MIKSQSVWRDVSLLHFWLNLFEDILLYHRSLSMSDFKKGLFLSLCLKGATAMIHTKCSGTEFSLISWKAVSQSVRISCWMATEVVQPHQLCTQKDRHSAFMDLQYIRDCLWIFEYSTPHGWSTTSITKHVQVTFHPEKKKSRFFCVWVPSTCSSQILITLCIRRYLLWLCNFEIIPNSDLIRYSSLVRNRGAVTNLVATHHISCTTLQLHITHELHLPSFTALTTHTFPSTIAPITQL